jgi:hypothetical protein
MNVVSDALSQFAPLVLCLLLAPSAENTIEIDVVHQSRAHLVVKRLVAKRKEDGFLIYEAPPDQKPIFVGYVYKSPNENATWFVAEREGGEVKHTVPLPGVTEQVTAVVKAQVGTITVGGAEFKVHTSGRNRYVSQTGKDAVFVIPLGK